MADCWVVLKVAKLGAYWAAQSAAEWGESLAE